MGMNANNPCTRGAAYAYSVGNQLESPLSQDGTPGAVGYSQPPNVS